MKMKKAIKKIIALGTGATMLGATLLGAMAYDLSDYPAPFVMDGEVSGVNIVVGANAATADVIGAIDIAASLQAKAYSEEAVEVEGAVTTVADGKVETDLVVGASPFSGNQEYGTKQISVLKDDKVRYNSVDYKFKETVFIDKDALVMKTGEDSEYFGTKAHLTVVGDTTDKLAYYWTPTSAIPLNFTADDTLEIEFLGEKLKITGAGTNSLTLSSAEEAWLFEDTEVKDKIKGEDFTIKIERMLSDTHALINVNGKTIDMKAGDSKDFGYENFELEVLSVYKSDTGQSSVKINYGSSVSETATTDTAAESLGYGDDTTKAEWKWDISSTATSLTHVGVVYNQPRNQIESELTESWEKAALLEGEQIEFPNDYVKVQFAKLARDDSSVGITLSAGKYTQWYNGEDSPEKVFDTDELVIEISAGEDVLYFGGDAYEKIIVDKNSAKVGLIDANGEKTNSTMTAVTDITVKVDKEALQLVLANSTGGLAGDKVFVQLRDIGGYNGSAYAEDLNWTIDWDITDDLAAGDFAYGSLSALTADYDFMTHYGVVVYNPNANLLKGLRGAYGTVKVEVPKEAMTWDLAVAASDVSVSSGASAMSQSINPIPLGLGMLDIQARLGSAHMIVVGGPCANSIAAELMGVTSANCRDGFEPNKAKIKFFEAEGKYAVLVAGYEATETRAASRALAAVDAGLVGDEVELKVTSVNSYEVGAPSEPENTGDEE